MSYKHDNKSGYVRLANSGIALLVMLAMLAGVGCTTTRQERKVVAPTTPEPAAAPSEMQAVADALLAYYAAHGSDPAQLVELRDAELISQADYEALPAYAYAGGGLGVLHDGSRVLLVDAVIRVPNRAWCIVSKPAKTGRAAVVETVLVSMAQLDAAAKQAR